MKSMLENNDNYQTRLTDDGTTASTATLVCLNFKVPLQVRQQFKIYAARYNMSMTELLLRLLDDCLTSDVTARSGSSHSQNKK